MVVFAIHSHESVIGVQCPPSRTLSDLPPHPIPQGCPSGLALSALFHALNLDWSSISHMVIYMFQCYSLKSSHPHTFSHQVQKSVLNICVSFAVLHIGPSLSSFKIPYIHVNILYWCFSFWLASFCTIGSSFIHFIRSDANVFLFIAELIFHCIHTPQLPYSFICLWRSSMSKLL